MATLLAGFGRRCSLCAAARRSSFLELGINSGNVSVRTPAPRLFFLKRTMGRMSSVATTRSQCWSNGRPEACSTRLFSSDGVEAAKENTSDTEVVEENASDTESTRLSGAFPEGTVVLLKRFPTLADTSCIVDFFSGLNIAPNGIMFQINPVSKKRLGSVMVAFTSSQDAQKALSYGGKIYRDHVIPVAPCKSQAFNDVLESIKEYKDQDCVAMRMTGMPYTFVEDDVVEFFEPVIPVAKDNVDLLYLSDGSFSGDAIIRFNSEQERQKAMRKNAVIVNSRAIHLIKITPEEYYLTYSRNKDDLKEFGSAEKNSLKLLSLPFSCSVPELTDFLGEFKDSVVPDGIKMIYTAARKFSGIAYVKMVSEEATEAAVKALNNSMLGTRVITVHKCYMVTEPLNPLPSLPPSPNKTWLSQTAGRKALLPSTVLVRGFPYSTSISELVQFFSDFNINEDVIEMTYDHIGRPSGSAYVTFPSVNEARRAIRDLNFKYIGSRYVELLQGN